MAKKPTDDLFEKSTMTFGEHLEELRVCLFRGVVGLGLGCLIGFFVANHVVRFFQSPLETAMEKYYLNNALEDFDKEYGTVTYEVERMILDEKLVPESMQIDAGQLSAALHQNYPEQFHSLHISPYAFTRGDLLDGGAKRIGQSLAAGRGDADTAAARCWQLLSDEERQLVQKLAEKSGPLSVDDEAAALRVLNALAGQRELQDAPEFARVTGFDTSLTSSLTSRAARLFGKKPPQATDTIGTLREQIAEKYDPEQSRRLNKLLLARVFPDSLKKARVNVLKVFTWRPVKVRFQSLDATEPFMIWMKAAIITGLVLASPYLLYQIWIFVAAGLYPHEKHYVFLYLPISVALFFGGAALAFAFVFQPVLSFLFTFNKGMNAEFDPRIGEWLSFVLILPLGFGISFQLPLVMLFLNRIGIATLDFYVQQWRVAILIICIISMVLTPADPVSMLLMAVPLCFLYLLGIGMCKYMPTGKSPFAEAYEP
jgi:sec-independent protein translocase protein TatC